MPTLVLLRHAKSSYPEGVRDHDRPLNERGEREAPVAGHLLAERVKDIDLALVSTARRAQQTWAAAEPPLSVRQRLDHDDLYLANSERLLTLVRGLPDSASTVVLVGHNDGLEELASLLTGEPVTLKTSTFAIVASVDAWTSWRGGSTSLLEVVVAR